MKKFLTLSCMSLAFAASSMFGATITYTSSPSGSITAPGVFAFSEFNPTIGTLTSISVTLTATVNTTLTVFNPTGGPLAFTTATVNVPFALTYTGGSGSYNFAGTATDNVGATVPSLMSFTETLPGTSTTTFSITPFTGYVGTSLTPPFTLASGGPATVSASGAQGLLYGGSGTGSLVASITYTYTPTTTTPEPAAMTLFGSALLGIGFFARKRIKKS
jgi:hypothetical protein